MSVARVVLPVLLLAASPVVGLARPADPPVNQHGVPVTDAQGGRLQYGREEMESQEAAESPQDRPAPSADLTPSGVTARWGYAGFGSGIGLSDIVLSDGEIITGGSTATFGPNDYFYILRPAGSGYEQVFVSRSFPGLVGLAVADVAGDARKEIVVVRSNGSVVLFDQRSREEGATLSVPATDVAGMILHDLDGNGKAEILLTTNSSNTLFVLSGTGAILWQRAAAGGIDVVVGNMDADPSPEIATTSGAVLDWASRTVQWQRAQGFGIDVEVGDIDSDGKDELIAAEAWGFIWAFDVDTQLPKWSLSVFNTGAIWVGNVDADPQLELLVGEAQWGNVVAFNTVTQAQEWAILNPEHGVTDVVIGDPNGDGIKDVLWGAGATSTGPDRLYVANLATRVIDWENIQLEGQFVPPQWGDIDGDGAPEIVTSSRMSGSGYYGGRIVVLDGATLAVRAVSPPVGSTTGVHDLRLRNVDADGAFEIVIATDLQSDGVIQIYDFAAPGAFALKWQNTVRPLGSPFYTADVADIDGDGQLEVVGGGGRQHTGSVGTFLYAYNYGTRAEEWHSFALTTGWLPIDGLEILTAGGGVADIVAMVGGETVNIYSGTGSPISIIPGTFRSLAPVAGATRGFLTGGDGGVLRQYTQSGPTYPLTFQRTLGGAPVDGVSFVDGGKIALTSAGRLSLYPTLVAPAAWSSEDYGVRGATMIGAGAMRRPFVGGRYGVVSLAPWRTLLAVEPPSGPFAGGTLVTALGTTFDSGARMFVGSRETLGTQVPDPTHVTGTTPPLVPCSANDVAVINSDMSYEILERAFTATCAGCPVIAVSPTTVPPAPVGMPYSQTFTQSGGAGAITWSLLGTVPDLTFASATGVLSGTPGRGDTFPVAVKATDGNGCAGSREYMLTFECPAITVNPATIPAGTIGGAYSQAFTQTGGGGTITWSLTGTLPTGLSLNPSTGVLAGTPTQGGTFAITVRATDSFGCSGARSYSLVIDCPPITVNPATIPDATEGAPYSQTFTQTGGTGPVTWSIVGTPPTGISLNTSTGVLSGTPTQTGSFSFTIGATAGGCTGSRAYTMVVNCPTITVNPATVPGATAGAPYSQTFTRTGGSSPALWSVAGALPAGLALSPGGILSGTPTQTGSFPITVTVTDAAACSGSRAYTLVVGCQVLAVSPPTIPGGLAGTPYSQTFTVTGGIGTVTWSLSGALPLGLTFNPSTHVLSGTPIQTGSFPITVTATDGNGCPGSRAYTLVVNRVGPFTAITLAADSGGNGVFEPGETAVLAPTWRNDTGAMEAVTGAATTFTGPAGPTYTVNDGTASYGSVPAGATGSCTATGDCYALSVAASSRPAMHWDATFLESLSNNDAKVWTVHVGRSFSDVPAANPFYRFIETILHRGVTGGCSATQYCPASSTTRDQMAVFVLLAKEGSGYAPPACGTPMFADVPASSPYCRWIEELARRGVVGGCGAGNYCPSSTATREAMAVFVLRTLDPALSPPACGTPMFSDVPASSGFCRWIEELVRRAVVSGCGGGNYCPAAPVSREQMSVFLSLTFGLTLDGS